MKINVYEQVTNRMIELLEQGVVPWKSPYLATVGFPKNFATGKGYRGINIFLLGSLRYTSPFFLTFIQAKELGGFVKKGERGGMVVKYGKEVLRKWLKAGYVEKGRLFETKAGTPQGGIISPTLANLTLDGLETLLTATFKRRNSRGQHYYNPKVALVRYADDFIVTGASKDLLENEVRPVVERFLRERGLELSPEKTCVTSTEEGFDFLGQNVRRFKEKLLNLSRRGSITISAWQ